MLAKFRTITLELGFVLIIGAFLYLFLSGDQLTPFFLPYSLPHSY
ncbi:hypothetical protein [Brevibacillus laterosporus]|nr:hypothetical protein [Brevibacillus laterosporus]